MKKRIIAIATVLMMAAAPAMAQVFIDDEDFNNRANTDDPSMYIDNPGIFNSGEDWYLPIGEGVFVLAGLAGAYLIGKRKKES
jgi:hypothetical protein